MAAASGAIPSLLEVLGVRMLTSKSEAFHLPGRTARQSSSLDSDQILELLEKQLIELNIPAIMAQLTSPRVDISQPLNLHSQRQLLRSPELLSVNSISKSFRRNMSSKSGMRLGSVGRKAVPIKMAKTSSFSMENFLEKSVSTESTAAQKAFFLGVAAKLHRINSPPETKWSRAFGTLTFLAKTTPLVLTVVLLGFMTYKHMKKTGEKSGVVEGGTMTADSFKSVKFSDVIGCDEVKEELQELVHYLKNPDVPSKLGGRIPNGVLLVGPPGVGKTMLAKAVATEAGVPFFYASGSAFDEVFVGVGANRVKELFALARKSAPSVVFIDEIDAVGGSRKDGNSGNRQTINQLLSEMDGFQPNEGVVVIGATNLGNILDSALTRAGRFDSKIVLHQPDATGRLKLIKHYMSKVKAADRVDLEKLANTLYGYTGAAIENLVNQAALRAANTNAASVSLEHLHWARDKIDLGRARKVHDDMRERRNTAYHEAAHTAVAHFLGSPYYSVTIERRGNTGGHMKHYFNEDFVTREQLLKLLAVALAGKLGEEVVEGEGRHTMGCSSDYASAQQTAANYIAAYGFGQKLYCAQDKDRYRPSDELQRDIDRETKILLDEAMGRAKHILSSNADAHRRLAEALLNKPTLTADEVKKILG